MTVTRRFLRASSITLFVLLAVSGLAMAGPLSFSYEHGVAYGVIDPAETVYWVVDANVRENPRSFNAASPTTTCPSFLPDYACRESELYNWNWVSINLGGYCDGQIHELSAVRFDGRSTFSSFVYGAGFVNVGSFGGKFLCSGGEGGDEDPDTVVPVIFVPAIMGSSLRGTWYGDDVQFWLNPIPLFGLPSVDNLTLDRSSLLYSPGLYPSDVVRNVLVKGIYSPLLGALEHGMDYKPYDISRHLTPGQGCDLSQKSDDPKTNPSLFVFPYDWRQDNIESAQRLGEYIGCVQQFYPPGTKIDLIAHSMGGLVVRRYILQSRSKGESSPIRKVVTMGTSFLGAPEAIYSIYTGGKWELASAFAASPRNIKFLAPHFVSMHQLFPSRLYDALRRSEDPLDRGIIEGFDFSQVVSKLNSDFPSTTPGTVGAGFHDTPGQDDWRTDDTEIQYYHLVGEQTKVDTTVRLTVKKSIFCALAGGSTLTRCHDGILYTPIKGLGDGTVPTISASRASGGVYLGAPGSKWFIYRAPDAEHTEITQIEPTYRRLAQFLGRTWTPPSKASSAMASMKNPREITSAEEGQDDYVEYDADNPPPPTDWSIYSPSYYVSITGNEEVRIRDESGNAASIENGVLDHHLPGLGNYETIGENSIMLTLSTGHAYSVEFLASDSPMAIEVVEGRGNTQPTSAVRYNDLDIPGNSKVRLTLAQDESTELEYDADHDGVFEARVDPTVALSGATAGDTAPPKVEINVTQQGASTATASILAQDEQSGVDKIWYSFDGRTFQRYTSPLTLQRSANATTIHAFADDLAANRSGVLTQQISFASLPTLAVKPILECVTQSANGAYTARFGYQNFNSVSVSVPQSEKNKFTPVPKDRGQVTVFQPGRVVNAFSVSFSGGTLKWHLTGPDGIQQNVSASKSSPRCQ